jgi:hypothetical protein
MRSAQSAPDRNSPASCDDATIEASKFAFTKSGHVCERDHGSGVPIGSGQRDDSGDKPPALIRVSRSNVAPSATACAQACVRSAPPTRTSPADRPMSGCNWSAISAARLKRSSAQSRPTTTMGRSTASRMPRASVAVSCIISQRPGRCFGSAEAPHRRSPEVLDAGLTAMPENAASEAAKHSPSISGSPVNVTRWDRPCL